MLKGNSTKKRKETGYGRVASLSIVITLLVVLSLMINSLIWNIEKPIRINSFMSIGLSFNTGVSFGLFSSFPIVVLILSLVIIFSVGAFFFLKVYKKELNRLESIGFSLLLAGALSNLIERIFYGRITDFIKIGWWPMFNIADSFICVGAGLLVVALVRKEK